MKRERLEELVDSAISPHAHRDDIEAVRAALLAVERETVERCAEVCINERVDADATREDADEAYNLACCHCSDSIRSLLTEE